MFTWPERNEWCLLAQKVSCKFGLRVLFTGVMGSLSLQQQQKWTKVPVVQGEACWGQLVTYVSLLSGPAVAKGDW